MPASDFYSPERVRKAAEALNREIERTPRFEQDAREALFQRALEEGLLNEQILDYAQQYDVDPEDARYEFTVADFPDAVPYSATREIDPYYEQYAGYRLAGQDPKVRQALINDAGFPEGNREALLDQVYQDVLRGEVSPADMRTLGTPFESRILNDESPSASDWAAANFIEQAGTRGESQGLNPEIWEGAVGLEEDLGLASRVANLPSDLERDYRNIRDSLESARQRSSLTSGLFSEDVQRRLNEFEQRIPPAGTPQTRQEATSVRNALYELQRDLTAFNPDNPYTVNPFDRQVALNTVLPSVRQALGDQVAANVAVEAARQQRSQRQSDINRMTPAGEAAVMNREYARQGSANRASLDTELNRLTERRATPSEIDVDRAFRSNLLGTESTTPIIPGLAEDIKANQEAARFERSKGVLEKFESVLEQYPEVRRLVTAAPFAQAPTRVRAADFAPYEAFVDREQRMSMPGDRAQVYDSILNSYTDPELRKIAEEKLRVAEDMYTSGITAAQRQARNVINELGGTDVLDAIEQPSYREKRPVVGGDFYIDPSVPAAKFYTDYIDKRAIDVTRAYYDAANAVGAETLASLYPGLGRPQNIPGEAAFVLDPETREVTRVNPNTEGAYRVKVDSAYPGGFALMTSRDLTRGPVSLNTLKFLAENPVTGRGSVGFDTARPYEGYSGYTAQTELPPEITRQFESFIKQAALGETRPGTLVSNNPIDSSDLVIERLKAGESPETSSTLRKLQPFLENKQSLPNLRGASYTTAGFGPVGKGDLQYAYVDAAGKVVPLQFDRPESGLRGSVLPSVEGSSVRQDVLPLSSTPRYYSVDPVIAGGQGALNLGRALRRTPSALLPGAADLIPSPEAIQTGYREGLPAMGRQMAVEFMQSLPVSAASAGILATPAAAPFAPGVGAGFVGVAGARALNEVVRQQTGEGIVPKLRQAIGTSPRTGLADRPQQQRSSQPARLIPTRQVNPIVREAQNRLGLARQRFNPARGEFGLSELLFGR